MAQACQPIPRSMGLEVEVDHPALLHLRWQEAAGETMAQVEAEVVVAADLHLVRAAMVRTALL